MIRWAIAIFIGWVGAAIASRILLGPHTLDPAAWSALDASKWWDQ